MVASIIFDVDGTLANSSNLGFTATNEILERNGFPLITYEEYHNGTPFPTSKRMSWHVSKEAQDEALGQKLGAEFEALYIDKVSIETTPFYPGIHSLLTTIREKSPDVVLSCLSNAATRYVTSVLSANGASSFFQSPLGADAVPQPKPSGLGLRHLTSLLGVDVKSTIYVGDAPGDGRAGKSAGCKACM